MKTSFLTFLVACYASLSTLSVLAQGVSINTDGSAPDASAILDVKSTNRGFLVPRVALTATNSASPVTSPATGLLVYNTATAGTFPNNVTPGFYYWDGTQWRRLDPSNQGDWRLVGNSGTSPTNNFLGTTDNQPLVIRTNNIERLRVNSFTTNNTELSLTGTASNLLLYNTAGVNAPTTGTRSSGTKAVWYPQVSGTEVDYATGIEGSTLWHSVPGAAAGYQHRFYGGTQRLVDIRGNNQTLLYGAGDNTFTAPTNGFTTLNVEGSIFMPSGQSLWLGNTGDAGDRFRFHHVGTDSYIDYATGFLQFRSGTTNRVRFLSTGEVGIGTTTPTAQLSVARSTGGPAISWGVGATTTQHSTLQTDQGGSIELGAANSQVNPVTNGAPYIDYHFGNGAAQDFNVRFINSANNEFRIQMLTSVKTQGSPGDLMRFGVATNGTTEIWVNQASPYAGDVFSARSDVSGDFGVNGYNRATSVTAFSGGVYGEASAPATATNPPGIGVIAYHTNANGIALGASVVDGIPALTQSTGIAVQARYYGIFSRLPATATSVAGAAVYADVLYTAAGTAFTTAGGKAAVKGIANIGGSYTFGVYGFGGVATRSGGVMGNNFDFSRGALGYYTSGLVDVSVYGFGLGYTTGTAGGCEAGVFHSEFPETDPLNRPMNHIGMAINGGTMGGWMNGQVYGFHTKGRKYGLYVDGLTYTNKPIIQLLEAGKDKRTVAFTMTSLNNDVTIRGKGMLVNGEAYVPFPDEFSSISGEDIVVTITPNSETKGVFVTEITSKGFKVKENGGGSSNASFHWIAVASRNDKHALPELDETVISKSYDLNMARVMVDDANPDVTASPIWWDGKTLRFDEPPVEWMLERKKAVEKYLAESPKEIKRTSR